jgi:hypothetical protein
MATGGVAAMAVTTHVEATAAPCGSWHVNAASLDLNLANGQKANLVLNGDRNAFSDGSPDAQLAAPNGDLWLGNAAGLLAGGNGNIDFTVIWTPQQGGFGGDYVTENTISSRFTGHIAADGTASGSADDNKGAHVGWSTAPGAYGCADAPPKADDPPKQDDPAPDTKPQNINCDDPAQFEANKFFCGMAKHLVEGPKDAVTMNINVGIPTTDVNIVNTSDEISGTCKYDATSPGLPGVHKTFDLGKSGSNSFTVLSPPPFTTYHVVLSCSGPWQNTGKTVEFGHVEQDVTAAG